MAEGPRYFRRRLTITRWYAVSCQQPAPRDGVTRIRSPPSGDAPFGRRAWGPRGPGVLGPRDQAVPVRRHDLAARDAADRPARVGGLQRCQPYVRRRNGQEAARALGLDHIDPARVVDRVTELTARRREVRRLHPRPVVEDARRAVGDRDRDWRDEVLDRRREAVRRAALQVRRREAPCTRPAGRCPRAWQVDPGLAERARAERPRRVRGDRIRRRARVDGGRQSVLPLRMTGTPARRGGRRSLPRPRPVVTHRWKPRTGLTPPCDRSYLMSMSPAVRSGVTPFSLNVWTG